ncbi:MAG TPA: hypothetical protein DCL77_00455 [Prolixibacteraceae bacterium]|nr:hypothetical protein [Prolixibacteraceae bacterium]
METTRINLKSHQLFLMIVAAMMIFSFSSCATKTHFLNSSVVPAAEGTVSIKKDKNKNYNIAITLNNLAEANRLQPPRSTYVVWMEGENNETKNIGQVKSSSSLLSKQLKGSFHTVSSVKPRKIFITAENDPSVQYPSNSDLILTTDYIKR